ncbi:MAG: DUF4625 domain-containing protein [Flavobacteriales bacterium]
MKKIIFYTLLALAISSCKKKEVDNEQPVITSASGDATVQVGTKLNLTATITDNKELKQLKIDIHDLFDGHGHRSFSPFSIVQIFTISGSSYSFNGQIDIPVNAATGPYHAVFYALDESGNQSKFREHDFTIVNPGEQPIISITSPDFSTSVSFSVGTSFSVIGSITDNTGLEKIEVLFEKANSPGAPIYDVDFNVVGVTSWDFQTDGNVSIQIPIGASTGNYNLIVKVKDIDGNYTLYIGKVEVM